MKIEAYFTVAEVDPATIADATVVVIDVVRSTTTGTPQGGVLSPLLANVALNFLDWHLEKRGWCFVRYADDFIVLCQTERQVKEVHGEVKQFLEQLGLTLSPEKTRVTKFPEGFTFLGFYVSSHSIRVSDKSMERVKDRLRSLTTRCHNLDAHRIQRANAVIRGVAQYFATSWSTCAVQFRGMDRWYRMRLRSMLEKRKSRNANSRIKIAHLRRRGCRFLSDHLHPERRRHRPRSSPEAMPERPRQPARDAGPRGRPVREIRTPVNRGN